MTATPDERIDYLITLTDRLAGLLAEQAQAFEARRPQDAARTLEEITRLANVYRHESGRVRADPSQIADCSAPKRLRLIQSTEAFDSVLARYGRAVDAAKTVTDGLVHAVAEEVASKRTTGAGYGAAGKAAVGSATAVTLNRRA